MSLRVLEKWFNIAPWKDAEFITDTRGEKYWISWRDEFDCFADLNVLYRGHRVGVIKSLWEENDSVTLADIEIFERYRLRGYGLGKAMMQEFIRWAREKEFKEIWGFIKPHNGTTTEYLKEWYKQQGFNVYETKPNIFHILMNLQDNEK